MLGNENGLLAPFQIGQEFRGLALQGSDKFRSHKVILKCHHAQCKRFEVPRISGGRGANDICAVEVCEAAGWATLRGPTSE
jgi:hypothetical protein